LRGADLDKILDDDYGDLGFNDPVPNDVEDPALAKQLKTAASSLKFPATSVAATPSGAPAATLAAKPAAAEKEPKERRPVLGATPPPPEGASPEQSQLAQTLDEVSRAKGFANAEEFNRHLEEKSGTKKNIENIAELEEQPLAPGIKKPPAWATPGAYPGDRTALGKAYDKEQEQLSSEEKEREEKLKCMPDASKEGVEKKYVKQTEKFGSMPGEGSEITYRLAEDGPIQTVEVGSTSFPWALEDVVRRVKIGDIIEVVGRGEHAFADDEEFVAGTERRWHFELISIGDTGKGKYDKFQLDADGRIDRANELRLRGNAMFKKGRLLRAMDYYERGAALMDVLEAEDMGGVKVKTDEVAAEKNRRIWACNKPLLLNWALILMKLGRWREAERKCTEVLMDIDKLCVKALFRRGVCNVNLCNKDQARSDLRRAAELDTSIAADVEKEMVKVERLQKASDREIKPVAEKAVKGLFKAGDTRSTEPPPKEEAGPDPTTTLMGMLRSQESAAERDSTDEDTYCRQREAIYRHFLRPQGAVQGEEHDDPPTKAAPEKPAVKSSEGEPAAKPLPASRGFCSRRAS